VPAAAAAAREQESRLHENLANANRACEVGRPGRCPVRRLLYCLLSPLIGEINAYHAQSIRVLNQLVRVLEGGDELAAGELLARTRERGDAVAHLSRRLAEYDRLNLEERLRKLEAGSGPAAGSPRP
jgi:hypothetical protein